MSDATQSGREMDARILSEVLGCKFVEGMPQKPIGETRDYWSLFDKGGGEPFVVRGHVWEAMNGPEIGWHPFYLDLQTAFEVVERMRQKGWLFKLCDGIDDLPTEASFIQFDGYGGHVIGSCKRPRNEVPFAICSAALASLSALEGERK